MSYGDDPNSWGDYLATPPNMCVTPVGLVSVPQPFSPVIPESEIENLLSQSQPSPSPITQSSPPKPQYQPPSQYKPSHQYQQRDSQQYKQRDSQQYKQSQPYKQSQQFSSPSKFPYSQQNQEHGEIENRSLAISNANPNTTKKEIMKAFGTKWAVSKIDMSDIKKGCFTVDFYDIREATAAKMYLNAMILHENKITINFAPLPVILDQKNPPNNGTIVIFHLIQGLTDDQIDSVFGQYGEIKQIRGTPSKFQQKFVEYYDTRSAADALVALNQQYVLGSKVSIEFSLPGGLRRKLL